MVSIGEVEGSSALVRWVQLGGAPLFLLLVSRLEAGTTSTSPLPSRLPTCLAPNMWLYAALLLVVGQPNFFVIGAAICTCGMNVCSHCGIIKPVLASENGDRPSE